MVVGRCERSSNETTRPSKESLGVKKKRQLSRRSAHRPPGPAPSKRPWAEEESGTSESRCDAPEAKPAAGANSESNREHGRRTRPEKNRRRSRFEGNQRRTRLKKRTGWLKHAKWTGGEHYPKKKQRRARQDKIQKWRLETMRRWTKRQRAARINKW